MAAQPTELHARIIDLFGNQATADPTKLYGNLTVNPTGTVGVGTGLILPDGYQQTITPMGRNRVINGGMDIWQRASTATGSLNQYQTVDRFGCTTGSGSGHTIALSNDVPNNAFYYSAKITVGTGAAPAAGNFSGLWHNIEGYNVIDFASGTAKAQIFTLSFWVKCSIAGTYALGFMNNGLNRNYITTYTVNTANTWQYVTVTLTADTAGTWNSQSSLGLSICWDLGSGTTYQTATLNTWQAGQMYGTAASTKLVATSGATFQITGVQCELGSTATPFERRLIHLELQACQRYYEQLTGGPYGSGGINGSGGAYVIVPFQTPKRATPTLTFTAGSTFYIWSSNTANVVLTGISVQYSSMFSTLLGCTFASGGVGGQYALLQNQGSSAILISAEM